MTVVADLHVHTTNSDGTLSLGELPAAARRAGLSAVAVTDHDRTHPGLSGPIDAIDGLEVVAGIELRVEAGERLDLLGFGVELTPELEAEVDRLQRDRIVRGAEIIERVEAHLGVELGLEPRAGLGRPHVARAIADHPATDYDVQGAFDHLIGDDGPCFVPRDVPGFDRGRRLLDGACRLVALAHPMRYADPEAAIALAAGLDGIERWYPYAGSVDPAPIDRAIDEHDLVPVGGSDAHDDALGGTGLSGAAYRRVRDALD